MSSMFFGAASFNGDISTWNVSSVTDMSSMFFGAASFNGDISTWNVSSVTDMSSMFFGAAAFNQPLNDWDVSSVTDMNNMFSGAISFNQPLNTWDTSSVTDMDRMFSGAAAFNGDISTWNISSAIYMDGMFSGATSFNQSLNDWNVSTVTDMSRMFDSASSFDQNLGNWYVTTHNTSINRADVPGKVGTIYAMNHFLDGQNPTYLIEPGGDSDMFTITDDNRLNMVSVTANQTSYAITIIASGGSVFEDGNNRRTIQVTLVDVPHDIQSDTQHTRPIVSGHNTVSDAFDGSGGFDALDGAGDVEVFMNGNRTYGIVVASFDVDAIQIMDITDPARPSPVSAVADGLRESPVLYGAEDVEVFMNGNRTYGIVTVLNNDENFVQIMDITDPARPASVSTIVGSSGEYAAWNGAEDVEVFRDDNRTYAIVTNNDNSGIKIIDLTDTPRPASVSSVSIWNLMDVTRGAADVKVFGIRDNTYAMVTAYDYDGLQIIDITDPARPASVSAVFDDSGGFDALDGASSIDVFDIENRTYGIVTGNNDDGVQIMDITDPANPIPVSAAFDGSGGFDALDGAQGVAVFGIGNNMYGIVTASDDDGVQIMDITDPANPAPVSAVFDDSGGFDALDGAQGVAVFGIGNNMYGIVTASDDDGVQIMDITDPANPAPVSAAFDDSVVTDVEIDLSQELADSLLAVVSVVELASAIFEIEDRTYGVVTTLYGNTTQIMDITDPANPVPVSAVFNNSEALNALSFPHDMDVFEIGSSTYGVVAVSHDGSVQIIDLTDPTNPTFVSTILDGPEVSGDVETTLSVGVLKIEDKTYGVVATPYGNAVHIVDITDPTNPSPTSAIPYDLGELDHINLLDMEVFRVENRAYSILTVWPDGIVRIIDITDPTNPSLASTIRDGSKFIEIIGNLNTTMAVPAIPDDLELSEITSDPIGVEVFGGGDHVYDMASPSWSLDPIGVEVFGGGDSTYAIMNSLAGIDIIDITDPTNPSYILQNAPYESPTAIPYTLIIPFYMDVFNAEDRTYVMLTTIVGGVQHIMDITDPTIPMLVWPVDEAVVEVNLLAIPFFVDVFESKDRMYTISSFPFTHTSITDITDPSNPISVPVSLGFVRDDPNSMD